AVEPAVITLLNLSRDQLDRVGEINVIERRLRAGLAAHPDAVVVANCDDVLMTSAAYDHANVVWVAAGGSWASDSVSCPRRDEVAGRYRTIQVGAHSVRMLLAKNPAGWQEALSMVNKDAAGVVIAVNGQVPDGEDLSWLWDVRFEHLSHTAVVAAGERGTDLA